MNRSAARKVGAQKARNAHSKKTRKDTAQARDRSHKTASKVAAKMRNNLAAETVRDTYRKIDAPFDQFRHSQMLNTFAGPCRAERRSDAPAIRGLQEHSPSRV